MTQNERRRTGKVKRKTLSFKEQAEKAAAMHKEFTKGQEVEIVPPPTLKNTWIERPIKKN